MGFIFSISVLEMIFIGELATIYGVFKVLNQCAKENKKMNL